MSHVPTTSTTRPAGSLALNESALTGESTPQLKEPLPSLGLPPSTRLNLAEHRACVALGGTKLLQHSAGAQPRSQQPPGGGAVGVVLRTGFHSSQGKLMLSLLDAEGRAHVCGRSVLVGLVFSRCCECTARAPVLPPPPYNSLPSLHSAGAPSCLSTAQAHHPARDGDLSESVGRLLH